MVQYPCPLWSLAYGVMSPEMTNGISTPVPSLERLQVLSCSEGPIPKESRHSVVALMTYEDPVTYYRRLQHQPPWSLPETRPSNLPSSLSDLQGHSQSPYHVDFPEFRLRIHLADKALRRTRPSWGLFLFRKHACLSDVAEKTPH